MMYHRTIDTASHWKGPKSQTFFISPSSETPSVHRVLAHFVALMIQYSYHRCQMTAPICMKLRIFKEARITGESLSIYVACSYS